MKYLEIVREWAVRLWGTYRHSPSDRDLERELDFHLEMIEQDLLREGHTPHEAARLARLQVGRPSSVLNALQEQRGIPWLGRFSTDVVLGWRMLRKSWGITLVGGLAITIVITVAAGLASFFQVFTGSSVPLEEGDRVVAIQIYDPASRQPARPTLADYERWRGELDSVENVGAFRTVRRSLVVGDGAGSAASEGAAEAVSVAEMSASGFRLARVAPLFGRPLLARDEAPSAPPVVVIGESVWRSRFGADPQVLGQNIRLGDKVHTVVGVMPNDFGFPVNHRYWVPLRADRMADTWSTGPDIVVFGRLAPSATLERAEAELSAMGLFADRAAADENLGRLRPRAMPYARAFAHIAPGDAATILLVVTLLLVPPCANIAILVYARTVTRHAEFAARVAFGASRTRIVAQIFIETLVLAALAALVALAVAHWIVSGVEVSIDQSPGANPFWIRPGISIQTIAYVAGLAVFAALIAGAVPALKATSGLLGEGLRALGNRVSARLGATWTSLVVAQIALAVAILPTAAGVTWGFLRPSLLEPGFPVAEFATARLELDAIAVPNGQADERGALERELAELQRELAERLGGEGISVVSFSSAVAGAEPALEIVVDEAGDTGERRLTAHHDVRVNRIDAAFLDAFGARILTGRRFEAGDFDADSTAVIVSRSFARDILGDASPLGREVRYAEPSPGIERRYEIVGVSTDVPANDERPAMYHPLAPGQQNPVTLALRLPMDRAGLADRLRALATRIDARLGVDEYRTLDETYAELRAQNEAAARALLIVTSSVLLLSAAGMYALMSFTVNQRRREIGIRAALGAQPGQLLAGVFRRAFAQVSIGAAAGMVLASIVGRYLPMDRLGVPAIPGLPLAAAVFMVLVGVVAAIGPARRALRADPTEGLREDG